MILTGNIPRESFIRSEPNKKGEAEVPKGDISSFDLKDLKF